MRSPPPSSCNSSPLHPDHAGSIRFLNPPAASARANVTPSPEEAPVTSAVFPLRSNIRAIFTPGGFAFGLACALSRQRDAIQIKAFLDLQGDVGRRIVARGRHGA